MRSRALLHAGAVALAVAIAGCGGATQTPPALAPVRLTLDAPADLATLDSDTVEVRGRVSPSTTRVLVEGEEVSVNDGAFSATVALAPGTNVVDVVAGAAGRPAAMTAVRVARLVPVVIPELTGQPPAEAVSRLRALGLAPKTHHRGGLIDDLLPGTDGVCDTDPKAGSRVRAGSRVTVEYAKVC